MLGFACRTALGYVCLASACAHAPPSWLVDGPLGAHAVGAARAYAAVWTVYFALSAMGAGSALALLALGYAPQPFFRAPLTSATSPIDFWSRRWNLLIKGLFHRSVFTPMRARGAPPAMGALAAFVVSGLFHEYAFMAASAGRALGYNLLFFVSQAAICTAEAALTAAAARRLRDTPTTRLAAHAHALAHTLADATRLRVLATTLALVPFSPLFMAPLRAGEPGTLREMIGTVPALRVEALGSA